MPGSFENHTEVARAFCDLSDAEIADIEKASLLVKYGWGGGFGWDEVLKSQRVLLISEAGAGKTHECKAQMARLRRSGEPAFFFELGTLATTAPLDMLLPDEEIIFERWLQSQESVATFFLDSIDELALTRGSFRQALTRFSRALAGQISRARVVVTTRPVRFDHELIREILPIPKRQQQAEATATGFADMALDRKRTENLDDEEAGAKPWRNVGLMPMSRDQQRQFALGQNVADPDALLDDIDARDAGEFAGRPQDLIELCADWREHRRIRSHRDQVMANIAIKLKPRDSRDERTELSHAKAFEGASRLALAAVLTRKLTIRHSAESDYVHASEPALDISKLLLDWNPDAQATLLERALFGFASYGRVRFHHRSVVEFLAAKHLDELISSRGAPIKSVKRLIFAETAQGNRVVRPSMRPLAAWLASWQATIFDELVNVDPATVLDNGDPQSLSDAQRKRALEAYVRLHRDGGWRGLKTPSVQVHRFASPELSSTVLSLWQQGIGNAEIRELLLKMIAAGKMRSCSDLLHGIALDPAVGLHERMLSIAALIALDDPRVEAIAVSVAKDEAIWPPVVARRAAVELFPAHMPVDRLQRVLERVRDDRDVLSDLRYRLRHLIASAPMTRDYLNDLREMLTTLVSSGMNFDRSSHPHLRTQRPDLMPVLAATCLRQANEGIRTDAWLRSALLSVRLSKLRHDTEESLKSIIEIVANLSPEMRAKGFWGEASILDKLHPMTNAYHRAYELIHEGAIKLNYNKDSAWVREILIDSNQPIARREMMLWVEMVFLNNTRDHTVLLGEIREIVSDSEILVNIVDERLKPRPESDEMSKWRIEDAERTRIEQERAAKAHASWVKFWHEIVSAPEVVFSEDRAHHTAWNLWHAMERSGPRSRGGGWNRYLIEQQFGKAVADRLREVMMGAWRKDKPTLASERPKGEKNTFLVRWQFGLAGIVAEAEDSGWAKRLSRDEAELACRYVPIQLNGFPSWLENIAVEHPAAVDHVLGEELSRALLAPASADNYSMALQDVSYASAIVATLFVPRVRAWLASARTKGSNDPHKGHRVRQAIEILVKNGSDDDLRFLEREAKRRLTRNVDQQTAEIWMPVLLRLNPALGVGRLERMLVNATVSKNGRGTLLFGAIFDRDNNLGIDLQSASFSPGLLLRLLRLTYTHVRIEDDENHEGTFSSGARDYAERARGGILSALLSAPGLEGWQAKLAMVGDPLFAHIKDRVRVLAEEKAAEEVDGAALSESDCVILDSTGETPPSTRDSMFSLMCDRLDDIDDLLLQDISPRETWGLIRDEHLMRREIARVLRESSRGNYTVDQEAVTADEKETDIRLRSITPSQQATIELKIGDNGWSGADLFDTLRDQLLKKYMAAEDCRSGCLLITLASDRGWDHPITKKRLNFVELIRLLNEECEAISLEMGGAAKLIAKGIDLRPRLGSKNAN